MTECPMIRGNKTLKRSIKFLVNVLPLFQDDAKLKSILGNWLSFHDGLFAQEEITHSFVSMIELAWKEQKKLTDKELSEFTDIIRQQAYKVYKDNTFAVTKKSFDMHEWEIIQESWVMTNQTPIADALRLQNYSPKLIETVQWIESIMVDKLWKESYKIRSSISWTKWVLDIYNNVNSSLKYAFLIQPWVEPKWLSKYIQDMWREAGIDNEWLLTWFHDNMIGTALWQWPIFRFIGWLKQLYSHIKYSLLYWLGWFTLATNNIVMWTNLLNARKRWLENIMWHSIIDTLIDKYNILKWQNKALSDLHLYEDQNWKNFFFNMIDKFCSKMPIWEKWRTVLNSMLQWWTHNRVDVFMEEDVKRTSIAQALSKNGFNESKWWIDLFNKLAIEWKISQDVMDAIRADSLLYYHDFFSNSHSSSLNRNRFSKRWMFNVLQWYVVNRSAWIYNAIWKFSRELKAGKIRTRWEFVDHIHTDNQELKWLIYNTLFAAKLSIYADYVANDKNYQNNPNEPYKYMVWMSDYMSSLSSTFFYRILSAPLQWLDSYYEYTAATGKKEEMIEWISVATINTLAQTIRSIFREWNVVNLFADAWLAFMKTWDLDFAMEVSSAQFDKISNGMWRYMLLPWVDTYWQKPIAEDDDIIWRIFMTYDATNKSVREMSKFRGISDIDSMLNDKGWYMLRLMQYLPIIKWFVESSKSTGWNEARYKYLNQLQESDPDLKAIWDGELPDVVLNNPNITKNLYQELTSFDYSYKKYKWEWEHLLAEKDSYWQFTQAEEEVFVKNIAEKQYGSIENMDKVLLAKWADGKNILKVLAASEAMTPWSSKIVLSYLARKDYDMLKTKLTGSLYTKAADIPAETEQQIKQAVVAKRYPLLYTADKTSQYKVVREYLDYAQPEIFGTLAGDNQLSQLVNTLAFNDLLVMTEWDKWDVDANYIKNIFTMSAKYITNDADRINITNNILWTISSLKNPTQNVKQLMKVWVLAWSIDFYNNLKKDPLTNILYKDDINRFENLVWQVNENINLAGNELAMWDLSEWAKKQYYATGYTPYVKSSTSDGNRKLIQQFQDKINDTYKPYQKQINYQKWDSNVRYTYQSPSEIGNLAPKRYWIYAKFYNEQLAAYSKWIVDTTMRQYPSQVYEWLKFTTKSYNRKFIPDVKPIRFKRPAKKYVSYKTRSDLPGSTDDIGAD